jgi:hypothetical protein
MAAPSSANKEQGVGGPEYNCSRRWHEVQTRHEWDKGPTMWWIGAICLLPEHSGIMDMNAEIMCMECHAKCGEIMSDSCTVQSEPAHLSTALVVREDSISSTDLSMLRGDEKRVMSGIDLFTYRSFSALS